MTARVRQPPRAVPEPPLYYRLKVDDPDMSQAYDYEILCSEVDGWEGACREAARRAVCDDPQPCGLPMSVEERERLSKNPGMIDIVLDWVWVPAIAAPRGLTKVRFAVTP